MLVKFGSKRDGYLFRDIDGTLYGFDRYGKYLGPEKFVLDYNITDRRLLSGIFVGSQGEIFVDGRTYPVNISLVHAKRILDTLQTDGVLLYRKGASEGFNYTQVFYPMFPGYKGYLGVIKRLQNGNQ